MRASASTGGRYARARVIGRALLAHLVLPALLAAAGPAAAQIAPERVGEVAKLPAEMGAHWVWASDSVLNRSALFDADSGNMLAW